MGPRPEDIVPWPAHSLLQRAHVHPASREDGTGEVRRRGGERQAGARGLLGLLGRHRVGPKIDLHLEPTVRGRGLLKLDVD